MNRKGNILIKMGSNPISYDECEVLKINLHARKIILITIPLYSWETDL
jgi:hypothetical protein